MWLGVIVLKSGTPDHKNYIPLLGDTDKKEEMEKNKNKQTKNPQKTKLMIPFITNFLKTLFKRIFCWENIYPHCETEESKPFLLYSMN